MGSANHQSASATRRIRAQRCCNKPRVDSADSRRSSAAPIFDARFRNVSIGFANVELYVHNIHTNIIITLYKQKWSKQRKSLLTYSNRCKAPAMLSIISQILLFNIIRASSDCTSAHPIYIYIYPPISPVYFSLSFQPRASHPRWFFLSLFNRCFAQRHTATSRILLFITGGKQQQHQRYRHIYIYIYTRAAVAAKSRSSKWQTRATAA